MNSNITHSAPEDQEERRLWSEQDQAADDADVMAVSRRLIETNRQAYEVLAR